MNRYEPKRIISFLIPRWWVFIALPICLLFPLKAEAGLLEAAVPSSIEGAVNSLVPSVKMELPQEKNDPESSGRNPDLADEKIDKQNGTSESAAEASFLTAPDPGAASARINLPHINVGTPVIKTSMSKAAVGMQAGHLQATLPVVQIEAPNIEIPDLAAAVPIPEVKLPPVSVGTPAVKVAVPGLVVKIAPEPAAPVDEDKTPAAKEISVPAAPNGSLLPDEGRDEGNGTPQPNQKSKNGPFGKTPAVQSIPPVTSSKPEADIGQSIKQKSVEGQISCPSEHEHMDPAPFQRETAILWPNSSLVPNPPSSSGGNIQESSGASGKVMVRFGNETLILIAAAKYDHIRKSLLGSDQWSQPPPGMPPEQAFFS